MGSISDLVASTGYSLDDLRGPCRDRDLVAARRTIARALRQAGDTYASIGALLDRSRNTVRNLVENEGWGA